MIVFEGLDGVGKSTQIQRLRETLESKGHEVVVQPFPDRTTPVGQVLDAYLKGLVEIHDRAVQLLFSANRWEVADKIQDLRRSGVVVLVDRYVYSARAYDIAKGLEPLQEDGLPKEDLVVFLDKAGVGGDDEGSEVACVAVAERYETTEFQSRVREAFDTSEFSVVDANGTIDQVAKRVWDTVVSVI